MPRTVDPHRYASRAALIVALAIALVWLWHTFGVVLEHVRGDVGP